MVRILAASAGGPECAAADERPPPLCLRRDTEVPAYRCPGLTLVARDFGGTRRSRPTGARGWPCAAAPLMQAALSISWTDENPE